MQLLLSLAAIIALIAFAWALGFRVSPHLDEARALAEAQAVLPGFRATQAALAEQGRGALVRSAEGGFAVVWPLADGWVARRVASNNLRFSNGNRLHITLNEPMQKFVDLRLADPLPDWLQGRSP